MCGIIAYTGENQAVPILIEGLKRLEYRGYDSAGIAYQDNGSLDMVKQPGKLSALESSIAWGEKYFSSDNITTDNAIRCGIGHTRWATHGVPNKANGYFARSTGGILPTGQSLGFTQTSLATGIFCRTAGNSAFGLRNSGPAGQGCRPAKKSSQERNSGVNNININI